MGLAQAEGARLRGLAPAALAASLIAAAAAAQEAHLLIVVGLGGEPQYAEAYHDWAARLKGAAEKRYGLAAANVAYLGEKPERDPQQISGRSTREEVERAFARLAERARPGDLVLVVLIGHGSFQSGEVRFSLPGPDLTAPDLKRLLGALSLQKVVLVNTASSSGELLKPLAGRNRVIVTATRSGLERNQTVFGGHFVEALAGDGADADKDGRVSVLEAFEYARLKVAAEYEKGNRLQTEHAVLEDADEGRLARALFLEPGSGRATEAVPEDPRLAALVTERRALEDGIESLKARKGSLPVEAYEAELERLLVELARKNEAIRAARKERP